MLALRPVQERALDCVRAAMAGGARRVVLQAATGFGKSLTAAEAVRRCVASGRRVLWITHRVELAAQSAATIRARGVRCGVVMASADESEDPGAPCQVAGVDTLRARGYYPPADFLVVDEAHHATVWADLLARYPVRHLLMTATPERADGRGLEEVADALVIGATYAELEGLGILVPIRAVRPDKPMRSGCIAQSPAEAYAEHAPGSLSLVFSPTVAVACAHREEFTARGVGAMVVTADTPAAERRDLVAAFRAGALPVLIGVGVFLEGFDAPPTGTVILARAFGTAGGFDQAVGRGLRAHPGKVECVLLDLVGASHVHGLPSEGREYSLTGVGIASSASRALAAYCRVCGNLVRPGEPCDDCGSVAKAVECRVVHAPLVAYDWRKSLAGDSPELRYHRLLRWTRDALAAGRSPRAAIGKFRGVYRAWPPRHMVDRALVEAQVSAARGQP